MQDLPTPSNILDLSKNGLKNLRQLRANTKAFKRLPLPHQIPRVQKIQVHYPYLCCIFHRHQTEERIQQSMDKPIQKRSENGDDLTSDDISYEDIDDFGKEDVVGPQLLSKRSSHRQASQAATIGEFIFPTLAIPTKSDTGIINQGGGGFSGNKTTINGNITDLQNWNTNSSHSNCTPDQIDCLDGYGGFKLVQCTPEPNVLTPCEDMLGEWYLKIPEWIMSSIALLANILVIIVIINAESHLTVTKFLVCNLAFADFCMGIYLTLMAIADAATIHQYANYAINWQTGSGCAVAGFIAIFSAELSTMTLTIITIERYLAIVHAMYYEKQLKLFGAYIAMSISWVIAIILALLPIIGVNSYSIICICLPADFSNSLAVSYIITLVVINGLAFSLIVYCYIVMYCTVHSTHAGGGNSATQSADRRIARRMALLIFSNFACWTPIAFFGLTSSLNLNLITVSGAKFLMVFIFPINATANPFLYSIFNQLFRKDLQHVVNKWKLAFQGRRRRASSATNNPTLSRNVGIKSHSTGASFVSDSRKRPSSVGDRLLSTSIFSGLARILKVSNSSENTNAMQLNGSNSSRNFCERSSSPKGVNSQYGRPSIDSQSELSPDSPHNYYADRNNSNIKTTKRYSKALKCELSDIPEVSYLDSHENSKAILLHYSSQKSSRLLSIETVV